jgi:hypothetical protein
VTREKLKFNEDMTQYVPPAQLWSEDWKGTLDLEYDHAEYWPALNAMCRERREEKLRRWLAGGSQVGESEAYLLQGSNTSATGVAYDPASASKGPGADSAVEAVQEKLAEATLTDADKAKAENKVEEPVVATT